MRIVDLVGFPFGRLTVIKRAGSRKTPNGTNQALWLCKCLCGREVTVRGSNLRSGHSQSCGCLSRELATIRMTGQKYASKHGHTSGYKSKTYNSFDAMCQRCLNPNTKRYPSYGGSGVTICDRWNPKVGGSFENFLADLGERLPNTTLGRYMDTGNYEKSNCAWQTCAEQIANHRPDRKYRSKKQVPASVSDFSLPLDVPGTEVCPPA